MFKVCTIDLRMLLLLRYLRTNTMRQHEHTTLKSTSLMMQTITPGNYSDTTSCKRQAPYVRFLFLSTYRLLLMHAPSLQMRSFFASSNFNHYATNKYQQQ